MPKNKDRLRRAFKRFISSNFDDLKKMDKCRKMFYDSGNFKELKGACLTADMKRKFIDFYHKGSQLDILNKLLS
jgi:hypothetical protein